MKLTWSWLTKKKNNNDDNDNNDNDDDDAHWTLIYETNISKVYYIYKKKFSFCPRSKKNYNVDKKKNDDGKNKSG